MTDEPEDQKPAEAAPEKRKPGRPPRAAVETTLQAEPARTARTRQTGPSEEMIRRRAERLSRGTVDHEYDKRLSLAGADLDLKNFAGRWVNDEPGRIARLQAQEWEIVGEEELNGLEKARHVGLSREGRPMNAVLMKKYLPWFEEDQNRKLKESREIEQALKRGKLKSPVADPEAGHDYAVSNNSFTVATPTKGSGGYTP